MFTRVSIRAPVKGRPLSVADDFDFVGVSIRAPVKGRQIEQEAAEIVVGFQSAPP